MTTTNRAHLSPRPVTRKRQVCYGGPST
jgi:hypothetical protein